MSYKGIQVSGTFPSFTGMTLFDPSWFGSNLIAWLAADQGPVAVNGSNQITTWPDLSGNGNSPVQATAANSYLWQTNTINGFPVCIAQTPTGTYSMQSVANLSTAIGQHTAFSCGFVLNHVGTKSTRDHIFGTNASTTNDACMTIESGSVYSGAVTFRLFSSNPSSITVHSTTTLVPGTNYDIMVTYDGSSTAAGVQFYINGVLDTPVITIDNLTTAVANGPLVIGNQGSTFGDKDGLAELCIVSGVFTTQQRTSLHQYFTQKYGV